MAPSTTGASHDPPISVLIFLFALAAPAAHAEEPRTLRVGVYDDRGISASLNTLLKVLGTQPDLQVQRLKADDIRSGGLAACDVLIQPGGSGSRQGQTLAEEGRQRVRDFVRSGGGYVGICAGAYLATRDYYHQGPLLAPADDPDIPDYERLATFAGEIARNGAPKGVMPGTTAIAVDHFGRGRVLCFSPHPERTEGLEDMLHRGIRWTAGRAAEE